MRHTAGTRTPANGLDTRHRLLGATLAALAMLTGVGVMQTVGAAALPAPVTLFGSTVPAVPADGDTNPVEVGVRFRADTVGTVTAIRFYKGSGNTGTHYGHLWDSTGRQLASVKFTNETVSGWQQANLSTPVTITAGQVYVASYWAPRGHYAGDNGWFAGREATSGPLHGLADGNGGPNGVYKYGSMSFPTSSWKSSNYYADIVFQPAGTTTTTAPPTTAPPTTVGPTTAPPTTAPPTTTPPTTAAPTTTVAPTTTTKPPTTTTTAPPSGGLNCIASPHTCGFPDGTNTGVPAGTQLQAVPGQITSGPGWHWDSRGWLQVDTPNAVVSNISVRGTIDVAGAPGTVIKNSYVNCEGCDFAIAIRDPQGTPRPSSDNVTIQDTTITADTNNWNAVYLLGSISNTSLLRVNISHTGGGVQTSTGGGWSIRDSYVHDLTQAFDQHVNGVQSSGGGNVQIVHNTILNPYSFTDAVMLTSDPGGGKQQNDLVQNNLLAGGGYTVYGGATGAGCGSPCTTANIQILNNRFARIFFPNSGSYGPLAAFNSGDPGNRFSGNTWDDTGLPVNG